MKELILLGAMAAAAAVWGADLSPEGNNWSGGGSCLLKLQPSKTTGQGIPLKLLDNCDSRLSNAEIGVVSTDDNNWWTYDNETHKYWIYNIFKFVKPAGFTTGTCYWQAFAYSEAVVNAYVWDPKPINLGGQRWESRSFNAGGNNPPTCSFAVSATDFDGSGVLWVLLETHANEPNKWWMKTDVCDIHY